MAEILRKKDSKKTDIKPNSSSGRGISYLNSSDSSLFVKAALIDDQNAKNNQFSLYRGTRGFDIGSKKAIDSPYKESLSDYQNALKNWPDKLSKAFLSIEFDSQDLIQQPQNTDTFNPFSLSYGNSLLAGTFTEAGQRGGARVLDYIRANWGYALVFSMSAFLSPSTSPSLQQKYMISPLQVIPALFAKGEFFHSRSKISLFYPNKVWGGLYEGINLDTPSSALLLRQDYGSHSGLIITPDISWEILRAAISHDIASSLVWLNEPSAFLYQKEDIQDTQKRFALFSSLEIDAFKDHFVKFQSVLDQIKAGVTLKPTNPQSEREFKPYDKSVLPKSQNFVIPETRKEERSYNPSQPFAKLAQEPERHSQTTLYVNNPTALSFDDLRKRTQEHMLIIPKGPYISFSHFIDFASDKEIQGLFRTIAQTAELKGLDKTGYRIITNNSLNPGQNINNDANQEVKHLHVHLAGGECLGKTVAGSQKDMTIEPVPFGFGMTSQQLYEIAIKNKIGERSFEGDDGTKYKIIAFRVPQSSLIGLTVYIGFLMIDEKNKSLYPSFHAFAKNSSPSEMRALLTFINDIARRTGIYQTGFRLIANHGPNAWQYPKDAMLLYIAGGNKLGITVSNVYGNHRLVPMDKGAAIDSSAVYDYKQLLNMPHENCPVEPGESLDLLKKLPPPINQEKSHHEDLETPNGRKIIWIMEDLNEYVKKWGTLSKKRRELIFAPHNFKDNHFSESLKEFDQETQKIDIQSDHLQKLTKQLVEDNKEYYLNHSESQKEKIIAETSKIDELLESFMNIIDALQPRWFLSYRKKPSHEHLLKLDKQRLNSLPDTIALLTDLEILRLNDNKLTEIPESLCSLPKLESLNLSNNQLSYLPLKIGNLETLKILELQNNDLQMLPESIAKLKNLEILDLEGNPLREVGENGQLGKSELKEIFGKRVTFD